MKISRNWLQTFFDEKLPSNEEIIEGIGLKAFEFEGSEEVDGDTVYEFDVLPNRTGDALSHMGFAREISVIFNLKMKETFELQKDFPVSADSVSVDIQTDKCRRYMARRIENISMKSVEDVSKRLEAIGVNSINPIVDIMNYSMFHTGEPLHVFDADKVSGGIVVRQAKDGEKIMTLSGEEKELIKEDIVIADNEKVLAIAGVKGGSEAGVTTETKNIIIEAANFDPLYVRQTSRRHNALTDSSKRFENDLSSSMCSLGLNHSTYLVLTTQNDKDTKISEITDEYKNKEEVISLVISGEEVEDILGMKIDLKNASNILKGLGFKVEVNNDSLSVEPPSFRKDVKIKEDVAEEIGRFMYSSLVPITPPDFPKQNKDIEFNTLFSIREKLTNQGFLELISRSFTKKGKVLVSRPVAKDRPALRESLIENMKEAIQLNSGNLDLLERAELKIFEIGYVFSGMANQEVRLCTVARNFKLDDPSVDIVSEMKVNGLDIVEYKVDTSKFIEYTLKESKKEIKYVDFSVFPSISRDISLWIGENSEKEIIDVINSNGGPHLVSKARKIDYFEKDGKKSVSFRVVFQANDRTLTDLEIEGIMKNIYDILSKKSGVSIR